jgi:hypothetical protein
MPLIPTVLQGGHNYPLTENQTELPDNRTELPETENFGHQFGS